MGYETTPSDKEADAFSSRQLNLILTSDKIY